MPSSEDYKNIANLLGITVAKVTKEHIALYENAKKEGAKGASTKKKGKGEEEEEDKKEADTKSTTAGFEKGPFVDLIEGADELKNALSPKGITEGVDLLITKSQALANNMGVGQARAAEFRAMIADSVPEMMKLGISQEEALKVMADIPKTLGVNTTLTKETIVEIGAASKISGVEAGDLANKFKGVGFDLSDVGDKMAEVANYAKSIGVNVEAVAGKVVANIAKLNTLNFEGGVKGLTKMVAQSEMLGINMDKVFRKGEELLNPESAIEFSSALQRLGVQSSSLLDPLSAMDMALNDPTELMNQMTKVSAQFTRMKADGSGFEILPGAKLQLREVAEQLGMEADEFANMSIKAADLDMKISKIRFPGFAASEEDKMLLANMSQMKDGRAVVSIANESGGTDEVDVENLTSEQLEKIKEEQANQNKSAEEIARDQLDVLKDISSQLGGTAKSLTLGAASAGPVQRMTNTVNELRRTVSSSVSSRVTTEGTRGTITGVVGGVEEGFAKAVGQGDYAALITELAKLPANITNAATGIFGNVIGAAGEVLTKGEANIVKEYSGLSGVKPGETNVTAVATEFLNTLKNALLGEPGTQKKTDINFNVNQTIDMKGSSDQMTRDDVFKINDEWYSNLTKDTSKMNKLIEGIDKESTSNGMAN